mgnify:CR=1 FL=1
MTQEDKDFFKRVTTYAEKHCKDLDPKKTKSSVQLDKLMPVFQEIANESGQNVEDVLVRYMDLSMETPLIFSISRTVNLEAAEWTCSILSA